MGLAGAEEQCGLECRCWMNWELSVGAKNVWSAEWCRPCGSRCRSEGELHNLVKCLEAINSRVGV